MVILGLAKHNGSVIGVVSRSGEISCNGSIVTGEFQMCMFVSFSELDSAHCFPLEGSPSDSDPDSSASLAALDRGSASLSYLWISGLGSPRYGRLSGPSCRSSCH